MKKIIQMLSLLLLLGVIALPLRAQSPDGETKSVGYRLKAANKVVTVYQDYSNQPNPFAIFSLESKYYFKIEGLTVTSCKEGPLKGKKYAQIFLPGKEAQSRAEHGIEFAEDSKETVKHQSAKGKSCDLVDFPLVNLTKSGITDSLLNINYWIAVEDLYENTEESEEYSDDDLSKSIVEANIRSRFFSSVLAVPFKYRFSFKNSNSSFSGESSIGAAVGWTFARDYDFDNRAWLTLAGGITTINPNTPFDDANSEKENNIPGATACLGIGANIKDVQAGFVFGYDFADATWEFHAKPWVAFSVGFAFWKPEGKPTNR